MTINGLVLSLLAVTLLSFGRGSSLRKV